MTKVRLEYGKAAIMALCAVGMVALCIVARTLDAASSAIVFAALTWYFVLKARVFSRRRPGGCRSLR